jgi:parallel beta-helix repeat protein
MPATIRPQAVLATLVGLAVMVVLVLAGVVSLSGAEAASNVSCGDTITTDTTLHHNLVNCPNNGIIIGADNVTLDLNYHTIDGDAAPCTHCHPRTEWTDIGVVNLGQSPDMGTGHDGVTVVHGSVREFNAGVNIAEASHNRVLGISASSNHFFGIGLVEVARSLVRNSSGSGSGGGEAPGMLLAGSHHVRVLHSSFRRNGDVGIGVFDSTHNLIRGNLLSRNQIGIVLEGSDRNKVRRNRSLRDGAIGIYIAPGSRNVIARNRISRTGGAGREGAGIEVDGGDHNVFARNSIRDTEGNAIGVGFSAVLGTVVRRNHIRRAGEDGVHVSHKAKHTLLRRNRARHSKDDGFDANNSTTKLTRNEARRNGDLGIEAVRGVVDGGGNIARHNGDPRQCINIACN